MRRIALGQPSFESGLILDAVEQGIILQDVIKNVTIDVRIVKSTVHVGEEPPPFTTRFVGLPHLAVVPPASIIGKRFSNDKVYEAIEIDP
mgnify:CR=1 FL=1